MATTTDIQEWLGYMELENNYEDVYCIYKSISEVDEWGAFKCSEKTTKKGSMYFLNSDYCDDTLMLASEKAVSFFIDYLEKHYVNSELDIEGWYQYKRAMAKDD